MSDAASQPVPFVKRVFSNLLRSRRPLWFSLRIVILLVAAFVTFVMLFEDRFIYFPSKYPEGTWEVDKLRAREGEAVPKVENIWMTTADGVRIHGWYFTPQLVVNGQAAEVPKEIVLLWFHGNAGNITHRYEVVRRLVEQSVSAFIIDYRGYGRSEGNPSETGLYLDAQAAWHYLTDERKILSGNIVILGDSLGGAVAIDLATKVEPAGLIVQSAFTSISDMAAQVLPIFPRFILRTKMDSLAKIPRVRCPKLFIHSPNDEMVPYSLGRRLYDAATEPKRFYEVVGASHNDIDIVGGRAYFDTIGNFVRSCAP